MDFYFLKIVFVRLINSGRIIYKTLAFFLYLSSITCPHVVEPTNFSSMVNMIWFGIISC